MSDEFDWSEFKGEEVVRAQQAVVVYENPDGDLAIRQEAAPYAKDDAWVVIPKKDVFTLIAMLKKLTEAN